MKYFGEKIYEHGSKDKTGVLITNLGTPDAPNARSLKIYLNQFLSDPRVIEIPKIIWQLILKLIILQIRPKKSAANYKKIWTDKGSPLLDISQRQLVGVKKLISEKYPKISPPQTPNTKHQTQNTKHKNLQFTSRISILCDIFDTQQIRDETPSTTFNLAQESQNLATFLTLEKFMTKPMHIKCILPPNEHPTLYTQRPTLNTKTFSLPQESHS